MANIPGLEVCDVGAGGGKRREGRRRGEVRAVPEEMGAEGTEKEREEGQERARGQRVRGWAGHPGSRKYPPHSE